MCLSRNQDIARAADLTHVKILAKAASNLRNEPIGVYHEGNLYKFEVVNVREYICITVKIGEVWKWQQ